MSKTFAQLGLETLDLREEDGIRAIDDERTRFHKHLLECEIAQKDITAIRPKDIALLTRSLARKQADDNRGVRRLAPGTVNKTVQLVRAVFDLAVELGYRDDNPCLTVRKVRVTENTEDPWTFLTLYEQRAIWMCEQIPLSARCLMAFAWRTGLRQGEQWNLEMSDLHVDGPEPHVFVRYGGPKTPPKSKSSRRRVPLFGFGLEVARLWLANRGNYDNDLVFPTVLGCRRPKGAPPYFEDWLRSAGITRHVRWHDLRHTCGSSLVSGVWGHRWDLIDVRDYLGHSSVKVTEMYAHLGETGVKRAAALTEE